MTMRKSRRNLPPQAPVRKLTKRSLRWAGPGLAVVLVAGILAATGLVLRPEALRIDRLLQSYREHGGYESLLIAYPLDRTIFPPEIVAPTFRWEDPWAASQSWVVSPYRSIRALLPSERNPAVHSR